MEEASEAVWAAAEAWVEAEAMAEEEAWLLLRLEDLRARSKDRDKPGDNMNLLRITSYKNYISSRSPILDSNKSISSNSTENIPSLLHEDNVFNPSTIDNNSNSSSLVRNTSPWLQRNSGSHDHSNTSPSQSPSPSPSQRRLFSPDKFKLKPTSEETKRKLDARQEAAETNRWKNTTEKKEKARLSGSRYKAIEALTAQKLSQANQAYCDKQKEAERRREEYRSQIRGKAGNENAKVSEVMFINSLNAEAVGEELQKKFIEVEGRILAGRQRRNEILEDITVRQRRRRASQSQQMSALRLQHETERMERWERLQKRLLAVQIRREERIQEMQRSEEEMLKVTTTMDVIAEMSSVNFVMTTSDVIIKLYTL